MNCQWFEKFVSLSHSLHFPFAVSHGHCLYVPCFDDNFCLFMLVRRRFHEKYYKLQQKESLENCINYNIQKGVCVCVDLNVCKCKYVCTHIVYHLTVVPFGSARWYFE